MNTRNTLLIVFFILIFNIISFARVLNIYEEQKLKKQKNITMPTSNNDVKKERIGIFAYEDAPIWKMIRKY